MPQRRMRVSRSRLAASGFQWAGYSLPRLQTGCSPLDIEKRIHRLRLLLIPLGISLVDGCQAADDNKDIRRASSDHSAPLI